MRLVDKRFAGQVGSQEDTNTSPMAIIEDSFKDSFYQEHLFV